MHVSIGSTQNIQSKPIKSWQGILIGLIFLFAGISLLIYSIFTINTYNEKNATFVETTATVVDYNYDSEGLKAIVVEYTVNGETYKKASTTYSNNSKSIGTEVSIKYNPNNPKDAIWTIDSTNIIMPIFSIAFIFFGSIILFINFKTIKKNKEIENNIIQQANGLYSVVDNQYQNNVTNNQQPQSNINIVKSNQQVLNSMQSENTNQSIQSVQINNVENDSTNLNNQNNVDNL